MQVRAKELGIFDGLMQPEGSIFNVPEGSKAKWFAPVVDGEVEAPKVDERDKPISLSELTKLGGNPKSFIEQVAKPKKK